MTTEATEAGTRSDETGPVYCGRVIIEWPAPHESRPLPGWGCAILNADTGKPVTTVEKLSIPAVTADAQGAITCWLTIFTDQDGKPLLELERRPRPDGKGWAELVYLRDGDMSKGIATGTFPFLVAEMRVRQP